MISNHLQPRLVAGHIISPLIVLCALLLLSSCATAPSSSQTDRNGRGSSDVKATTEIIGAAPINIEAFQQVKTLARQADSRQARALHEQLQAAGLSAVTSQLIESEIAWLEGDVTRAHALTAQISLTDSQSQQALLDVRISRAIEQQQWLSAAHSQADKLSAMRRVGQEDIDRLWGLILRAYPLSPRERARGMRSDLGAWVELADAYFQGPAAVLNWQQRNANHLATRSPPSGIVRWINARTPQTIATLLPLSGKLQEAGEALLSGMVTALYTRYPDALQRPQLIAIDTEMFDSVETASDEARAENADIILGPLVKPRVSALARQPNRQLPVIALNRGDYDDPPSGNWLTLSLAPEDEAQQLSELAFAQGHRRALFIAPETEWGTRMLKTAQNSWRQLGGTVVDTLHITRERALSIQISQLVAGADSEERIKAVEEAFLAPVDARPRRRQDIDTVFMLAATSADARAIRPLLVYHFSGDLQVFAPSTIYNGFVDSQNRDLNGVTFVDIPAMLASSPEQRFARLEALGQDAVAMIEHWQQALDTSTPLLAGKTGLLLREPSGDVRRILETATFDGGIMTPHKAH